MPQKQQKRPSPLEDPPTASSSSESEEHQPLLQEKPEEEEASSEEVASSEEDEDEDDGPPLQSASKTPSAPPPTATNSHLKPPSVPDSDSATQSDSESDTDSDQPPPPPPPNPKVKPIATKPMDQVVKSKAQAQAQPSSAPAKSASKRAPENNAHAGNPKRAKKKAADTAAAGGSDEEVEEDGKKPPFQRLYSNEDEIAILKGLAEFTSKTGNDPLKHTDAFYDFVKKSLQGDANSNQLKQKVRRLKKKFQTLRGKGKNGEDPSFPRAHDQKTFELAKKVWGSGGGNEAEEKPKSNGKPAKSPKKEANSSSRSVASAKKSKPETRQEPPPPPPESDMHVLTLKESADVDTDVKADSSLLLGEMFRYEKGVSGLNEDVVKKGLQLIGASKRAELEGRWKKLEVEELELFVKRAQLMQDQSRLILEAYKSSNN